MMQEDGDAEVEYVSPFHTLEHIMPQTYEGATGWNDMDSALHRSLVNSFGNFALAGGGYNSAISNRPLREKLPYYSRSSYALTRRAAGEIATAGLFRDSDLRVLDWDKLGEFFRARARRLADYAVNVLHF